MRTLDGQGDGIMASKDNMKRVTLVAVALCNLLSQTVAQGPATIQRSHHQTLHRLAVEAATNPVNDEVLEVAPEMLIIETVIRESEKFSYCVEYLDNLHPNRNLERELQKEKKRKEKEAKNRENKRKRLEKKLEEANDVFTDETIDRYSY